MFILFTVYLFLSYDYSFVSSLILIQVYLMYYTWLISFYPLILNLSIKKHQLSYYVSNSLYLVVTLLKYSLFILLLVSTSVSLLFLLLIQVSMILLIYRYSSLSHSLIQVSMILLIYRYSSHSLTLTLTLSLSLSHSLTLSLSLSHSLTLTLSHSHSLLYK